MLLLAARAVLRVLRHERPDLLLHERCLVTLLGRPVSIHLLKRVVYLASVETLLDHGRRSLSTALLHTLLLHLLLEEGLESQWFTRLVAPLSLDHRRLDILVSGHGRLWHFEVVVSGGRDLLFVVVVISLACLLLKRLFG